MKQFIFSLLFITTLLPNLLQGEFLFDGPHIYYRNLKTAEEEFESAKEAWMQGDYSAALISFEAISDNYPRSPLASESLFRAAKCLVKMNELEAASEKISAYLKSQGAPAYFKEALTLKFQIAEKFRLGNSGRPLFGVRYMPKWLSGDLIALEIYDEIATILPSDPLAAEALFAKGTLLKKVGQWKEAIDAFQTLIRRFPQDPLAAECYVIAGETFKVQSEIEIQNPDILGMARVNLKRFETDFPSDERVELVRKEVVEIEESYAQALFETGMLYERKGEPQSACIYYKNTAFLFPQTQVARLSERRLQKLDQSTVFSTPEEQTRN